MTFNFLRGPGNGGLELTRIIGASGSILYPFPFIWNVIAHGVVPDPASFGTGYAAVFGAIGIMIGAKDMAVAKANATTASSNAP